MRGLVWFRRDLRLADQPALTAAAEECDEIIPLFIFDNRLLQAQVFGPACVSFMVGCLRELAGTLGTRGLPLHWRHGDPVTEVVSAARDWNVGAVYWNRDYEPGAIERDRIIQHKLTEHSVQVRTFKDHVVFEAEEIRGATGEPLQRYSAYRARWWRTWQAATPSVLPVPKTLTAAKAPALPFPSPLPSAGDLGYSHVMPWIEPGERRAQERLRWFLNGPINHYGHGRTRPALDGSSRLSPHFRFGTLSPRLAIHSALKVLTKGNDCSRSDVHTWIDELIWREFFQQVLAAFPHVTAQPFRRVPVPPSLRPGPERDRLFQAWCDGQTGFPIVDAGMRQLNQTGWMPNRVRMIVASFLIKDLWIDWQSGEQYFMRHLLDADVAANNGNWQWCAATGADAMPGYRIFNPVLQSTKFDPDGAYIRRYVPALIGVPPTSIHTPHLMTFEEQVRANCRIGIEYPAPIVDHRRVKEDYLAFGKQRGIS
ncbi:cryptochrome/photolyase family protein [Nitrospira sp. Nam74]